MINNFLTAGCILQRNLQPCSRDKVHGYFYAYSWRSAWEVAGFGGIWRQFKITWVYIFIRSFSRRLVNLERLIVDYSFFALIPYRFRYLESCVSSEDFSLLWGTSSLEATSLPSHAGVYSLAAKPMNTSIRRTCKHSKLYSILKYPKCRRYS